MKFIILEILLEDYRPETLEFCQTLWEKLAFKKDMFSIILFVSFPEQRNQDLDPKEVRYGVVYRIDMLARVTNLGEAAYQSIMRLNFTSDLQVIGVEVNSV